MYINLWVRNDATYNLFMLEICLEKKTHKHIHRLSFSLYIKSTLYSLFALGVVTLSFKGGGEGRRSVTLCDKGGKNLKFSDITFQN